MHANERIARLETRADNQEKSMDMLASVMKELTDSIERLNTRLIRMIAFCAGGASVFTAIGGVVGFCAKVLLR